MRLHLSIRVSWVGGRRGETKRRREKELVWSIEIRYQRYNICEVSSSLATMKKIVAFGDSLTQRGFDVDQGGWLAQLANAYVRRFDVVNRGYSGRSDTIPSRADGVPTDNYDIPLDRIQYGMVQVGVATDSSR